jgi:hypothetical protein
VVAVVARVARALVEGEDGTARDLRATHVDPAVVFPHTGLPRSNIDQTHQSQQAQGNGGSRSSERWHGKE